jgi:hypothetical protein
LNESSKFDAVKTQLKFRKKVLKSRPDDKTLLQFLVNGIPFTFDELFAVNFDLIFSIFLFTSSLCFNMSASLSDLDLITKLALIEKFESIENF